MWKRISAWVLGWLFVLLCRKQIEAFGEALGQMAFILLIGPKAAGAFGRRNEEKSRI